ncbi:MAG: type II CRISPR RNA-guided endonuclease Cas9, partial [Betaproteobacteria bacterium]
MRYRLALDIGTASCGLVAVELNAQGEPVGIIHRALHVFSEPLLPAKSGGVGEPKKAARRAARMARRVIDRRARRLKRISRLAALLNLDQGRIPSDTGQELHAMRAKAVTSPIGLDDFLRVLLKLAKRRGYAGDFKIRKDSEQGQVQSGISALANEMKSASCATLGQYLHERFKAGKTLKLKEAGLYAHRKILVDEFNAIWDEQQRYHPILADTRPDPLDERKRVRPIRDQFFDAIFFQRPLKSVAPMVGNCSLEPSLPRAPMAQPATQAFRIEKQLADLRWGMGRNALPLSQVQRDAIREMLSDPAQINKDGKLKFEKIYKRLDSIPKVPGQRGSLNMERSSREDLTGNRTLRAFKDLGVLESWQALDGASQLRLINFLADLGSPDQVDQPAWHTRFTKSVLIKNSRTNRWEERQVPRTLDPKMVAFIDLLVETEKFDRLSNMGLQTGRASYSIRTLERLTDCMRSEGLDEHNAIQKCYPPEPPTGELLTHLPPHRVTGNVVVDVALSVVRRATNDALAALREPPSEVVVELSRDMALGIKARGEIEKKIEKNRKRRENARKELVSHDILATERKVLRFLLWEQQGKRHCPYCSEPMNLEQAIDGNATNFEHILPRTLTRVGRQRNHLVLAHRSCNDLKRDRTPYEAFGHDENRWAAVTFCASVLEGNKQFAKARLLKLQDYEHEVLDNESIADFSERQYAETSWIGKLTAQWMREISAKVSVSRGSMTAHLRRIWKLETVIAQARFDAGLPVLDQDGEKFTLDDFKRFKPFWEGHTGSDHPRTDRKIDKRIDHRHHLIDALVIAQTSVSLYQRIARHYKELAERRAEGEPIRLKLEVAPPIQDLREQALEIVRAVAIRHKPDRQISGNFFKGLPYRKRSMDNGRIRLTI